MRDKKSYPSEKSLKNLRPARKGEVRNPKGKPKGSKSLKTLLKAALNTPISLRSIIANDLKQKYPHYFTSTRSITLGEVAMLRLAAGTTLGNPETALKYIKTAYDATIDDGESGEIIEVTVHRESEKYSNKKKKKRRVTDE